MMETKICTKCGESKELIDYYHRYNQCKACCLAVQKAYRNSNKDASRERRLNKYWSDPASARKEASEYLKRNSQYKQQSLDRLVAFHQQHKARIEASHRDRLSDNYVKKCFNLPSRDVEFFTPTILQMKRQQLQIYRARKQLLKTIKEKQYE